MLQSSTKIFLIISFVNKKNKLYFVVIFVVVEIKYLSYIINKYRMLNLIVYEIKSFAYWFIEVSNY